MQFMMGGELLRLGMSLGTLEEMTAALKGPLPWYVFLYRGQELFRIGAVTDEAAVQACTQICQEQHSCSFEDGEMARLVVAAT